MGPPSGRGILPTGSWLASAYVVSDALPYLGLPPGGRFQLATGHEDVWEDISLLGEG